MSEKMETKKCRFCPFECIESEDLVQHELDIHQFYEVVKEQSSPTPDIRFDLIKDMTIFKLLTDGEIDYEKSIKMGFPIVKGLSETWMNPKNFEEIKKKISLP